MELVELIAIHQYSVDFFPYPGLSGILGSGGKRPVVRKQDVVELFIL